MKVNSDLFEGIFPVRLEGKNADGEEYSYRAFSVREVLDSLSGDMLVEFISRDGGGAAVSGEEILTGQVYLAEDGDAYRLILPKDRH
ncbi:hypothetical protein NSB04_24135, partial [Blautia pseudococcoides]|nr:hypothetical protein [Blautia pseudococcoides]